MSFERQLGTSLAETLKPPSVSCLDAETLAAWSAGTLAPDEARHVELHLADCARCQAMLAAFAESEEPAAVAVVLPFWRRPGVRWATSLAAAAAAAAVIWIGLPKHGPAPSTTIARVEPAPSPAPPPVVAAPAPTDVGPGFSPAAGTLRQESATPAPVKAVPPAAATREAAAKAAEPMPSPQSSAIPPPPPPADKSLLQAASGERSDVVQQQQLESLPVANRGFRDLVNVLPGVPPTSAAPAPQAPAAAPATPGRAGAATAPRIGGGGQDNIMIDGISTLDTGNNGLVGAARAAGAGGRGGGRGAPVVIAEIVSGPSEPAAATTGSTFQRSSGLVNSAAVEPPTRWRVLANRTVQRSTTNGATWIPVTIDPALVITNGSAPSRLVCWLIGRTGVVLRTTDGSTFEKVPFPLATDLASIVATDARSATVTTTTGLVYATTDGGASWAQGH